MTSTFEIAVPVTEPAYVVAVKPARAGVVPPTTMLTAVVGDVADKLIVPCVVAPVTKPVSARVAVPARVIAMSRPSAAVNVTKPVASAVADTPDAADTALIAAAMFVP